MEDERDEGNLKFLERWNTKKYLKVLMIDYYSVTLMDDKNLLVANIGWSFKGWRGFDEEMFNRKKLYKFDYITNTGFGHEVWNFYDGFGKNVYFGHIESSLQKFTSGVVLFVSKYIDPQDPSPKRSRFYFIGVYGNAIYEPQGFHTGTKVIDLLPEYAIENIKDIVNTENWKGNNAEKHVRYLNDILNGKEYIASLVASKKYSTVFLPIRYNGYVELEPEDIGVKDFKEWKITYKITPEKATRLLDIAIIRHERVIKDEIGVISPQPIKEKAIEIVSKLKKVKNIVESNTL